MLPEIYKIFGDQYKDYTIYEGIKGKTNNSNHKEKRLRCMIYMNGEVIDDNEWNKKFDEIKDENESKFFDDFIPFKTYIESYSVNIPNGGDEEGMIEHIPSKKRDFCICGKDGLKGFHPIKSESKKIIIVNIGSECINRFSDFFRINKILNLIEKTIPDHYKENTLDKIAQKQRNIIKENNICYFKDGEDILKDIKAETLVEQRIRNGKCIGIKLDGKYCGIDKINKFKEINEDGFCELHQLQGTKKYYTKYAKLRDNIQKEFDLDHQSHCL